MHKYFFSLLNKDVMRVIVKTRSNFRNLNGQLLTVKEIVGTRVTCEVEIDGVKMSVDFHLNEVVAAFYPQK